MLERSRTEKDERGNEGKEAGMEKENKKENILLGWIKRESLQCEALSKPSSVPGP